MQHFKTVKDPNTGLQYRGYMTPSGSTVLLLHR